jgi:hypothetical protein
MKKVELSSLREMIAVEGKRKLVGDRLSRPGEEVGERDDMEI